MLSLEQRLVHILEYCQSANEVAPGRAGVEDWYEYWTVYTHPQPVTERASCCG